MVAGLFLLPAVTAILAHMPDSSPQDTSLVFVYNADTGLFNTLADIGHKIFSPQTYQCDLCMLTHGYLSERGEWREFVEGLPLAAQFLHRDEFKRDYPQLDVAMPAVFLRQQGEMRLCVNAGSLHDCNSLQELKNLIVLACEQAGN